MREVWRGYAAAWECDELGHLNVAHYLAKAMEGVAGLGIELGLADAFTAKAFSTLRPRELHVRFLRESRPGAPLYARAGVIGAGEDRADIYLEILHSATDAPSAALRIRLEHVSARTGASFPWGVRTRERLEALRVEPPDRTAPRGVDPDGPVCETASRDAADALGLATIGRGVIQPEECTVFGWHKPATVMARISNSVSNFAAAFPEELSQAAEGAPRRLGSALVEARIVYRGWPRAGSAYEIRSGVTGAEAKTRRLVHWMLDTVSGRPWASMEGVALLMDLEARKAADYDPDIQARLRESVVEGLGV